jgi:REP element-mobilizing transposase RayT
MPHTYCSSLYHCVFSTRERRKIIPPDVQGRLWAYMGGIARGLEIKALEIGGMDDHAHLLLSLPSTMPVATAMREIKGSSSQWLHENCALPDFAWQQGYGAFSISSAQIETTAAYIAKQIEHHRKRNFQSEFLAMLKKQGIAYDPRFIWG